ncbi:MAG: transposase [Thermoguttaceae bacterium]|nr:transposase [Thermoguttaceae bacterium]
MYFRGENKNSYKRSGLPHRDHSGVRQALTYRLWDSIPQSEVLIIEQAVSNSHPDIKDYALRRYTEACLNRGYGSGLLKYPEIAKIVLSRWFTDNGKAYDLYEWVIMPNHVHLLFRPYPGFSLCDIIQSWKMQSGKLIRQTEIYRQIIQDYPNDLKDSIWNSDYFDREIRSNAHFHNMKKYIYNNPIGLIWNGQRIERPEDWPFSSASTGWQSYF